MSSVRRRAKRIRLRVLRRAGLALAAALVAWTAGLVWFAGQVPRPEDARPPEARADAVVVLTGGAGRLDAGLRLLAEGHAEKLFVSGVARGVDVTQLLRIARRQPEELACCIAIGYAADNTAGNARETAAWMRSEGYGSMLLVTANYHMPRSLVEFRAAMPGIRIVPRPVFPGQFMLDGWWRWPGTAVLLASEYSKYILARLQPTLHRPEPREREG
jgi:uncharacterized SAM-binding protein YcdF (DUF218 family)